MHALLLLGLSVFGPPASGPAPGSANGDANAAYGVHVCLRFSSDPVFTPLYVRSIQRQLESQLNAYFRPLATFTVHVDGQWLIDAFPELGVDQPAAGTELWDRLERRGKHFLVGIDHAAGQYQVACRELDADAQRAGPIDQRTTPDRQWVSRAIGLAVQRNFGLSARITPLDAARQVQLEFRGAAHTERITELLGQDCVFQAYRVLRGRDGLTREEVPGTVLRLGTKSGLQRATVFSNEPDPWKRSAAVAGFEAYSVRTQPGRVRLTVVDAGTGRPAVNCYVSASDEGFEALKPEDALGSPDPRGVVTTGRLNGVAFVQITQETSSVVKWAIPITREVEEQVVRIFVDEAAGEKNRFQRRLGFAVRDVQTLHVVQSNATERLNALSGSDSKRYEEALQLARTTISDCRPLLTEVKLAATRLQTLAGELQQANSKRLGWLVGQLERVEQQHASLVKLEQELAAAIESREAAGRAKVVFELGLQAEAVGDIDQAAARYQAAVDEFPDPEMQRKLAEVRRLLELGRGGPHAQAHRFIYERWASTELADLEQRLPEARQALATLQAGRDPIRARKLLTVNDRHLEDLSVLLDQLAERQTDADRAEYEQYAALAEELAAFQKEIGDFITRRAAGFEPAAADPAGSGPAAGTGPAGGGAAAPAAGNPAAGGGPRGPAPGRAEEEPPLSGD